MFIKRILFASLLMSSFSAFVIAKDSEDEDQFNSEKPLLILKNNRDNLLKLFLVGFKISAPLSLMKHIVALTDDYTINQFAEILIDIICLLDGDELDYSTCLTVLRKAINKFDPDGVKQEKLTYLDQIYESEQPPQLRWVLKEDFGLTDDDRSVRIILDENERDELIKSFFLASHKFAPESLIADIVELTDGYTRGQFMEVLIAITSSTKESDLKQFLCLEKLEEAIHKFDIGQAKEEKMRRLERIIQKLSHKTMPFDSDAFKRHLELTESERSNITKERLDKFQKAIDDEVNKKIYSRRPIAIERLIKVEEVLSLAGISAPKSLIADIVELTDGYTRDQFMEVLIAITSSTKESALDQFLCLEKLEEAVHKFDFDQRKEQKIIQLTRMVYKSLHKPILFDPVAFQRDLEYFDSLPESERRDFEKGIIEFQKAIDDAVSEKVYFARPTFEERLAEVEDVLSLAGMSAPESLIADIAELTVQYSLDTVTKIVKKMIKKSKTNSLDPNNCIEILREAIDLLDDEEETKN